MANVFDFIIFSEQKYCLDFILPSFLPIELSLIPAKCIGRNSVLFCATQQQESFVNITYSRKQEKKRERNQAFNNGCLSFNASPEIIKQYSSAVGVMF